MDLRAKLQATLSGTHTVERELGGGGMSRVFVAVEHRLKRQVVVKVLSPDLAQGLSAERFEREIELAAQLQHPHIVPVLSAGELDGLPYLTMPFVAGRSLRERLIEQGPLPLDEAIDILRDVARALAFAHGRGVIHRDIKPDNVLLAEGSATVTDFGIAKAVAAARADVPGGTLTSVGTSIGTPAYMAPEQAAGDPATDHRADIYAWGVMAFEILTGRPPFTATAPHKLLAAHMSESPDSVVDHRPDCPPALSDLVAQCLAKDPIARPQTAGDVLRALAEVKTPSGAGQETLPAISAATRRTLLRALGVYVAAFVLVAALAETAVLLIGLPGWVLPGTLIVMALGLPVILATAFVTHGSRVARTMTALTAGGEPQRPQSTMTRIALKASPLMTWRRAALGGAVAVGGFALLVVGFMAMRAFGIGPAASLEGRGLVSANDRILVADFTAAGAADTSLGSVVSEGVRTGLAESQTFGVAPITEVAATLERMQRPTTTHVDLTLGREIAQREGIKAIVDGKVTPVAGGFIISMTLYATADSAPIATYQETAKDMTEIIPAVDRGTRRVREKVGDSFKTVRQTVPLQRVTTASLPALEKYSEGFRLNYVDANYTAAAAVLEDAVALDSTFAVALRLLAFAYYNAGLRPGRTDSVMEQAFRHRDRLPEVERALVEGAYYEYADHYDRTKAIAAYQRALATDPRNPSTLNNLALLRREGREFASAESLFKRLQVVAPDVTGGYGHLIEVQLSMGKLDEAKQTLAAAQQRWPREKLLLRSENLAADEFGATGDSVASICRAQSTSGDPLRRTRGLACLFKIAAARGQLRDALADLARYDAVQHQRGAETRTPLEVALDSADLLSWWLHRPTDAIHTIEAAVATHPLREEPLLPDPLSIGVRFARLDRTGAGGAPLERPYLALASAYAEAGAPAKARDVLHQYDADVRDSGRIRADWSDRLRTESDIAIAEHRYADAVRLLQRSDTAADGSPVLCDECTTARLGYAYDLAGEPDKAIAAFEAYLASHDVYRLGNADWRYLGGTYKRLGELYEAKGDTVKAAAYLTKFIALWKDADPELQPVVTEVRQRLQRLRSGGG